jgi:hypothetical protein
MLENEPGLADSSPPKGRTESAISQIVPGLDGETEAGLQKVFLPRGSGESRFAPPQYYYLASRSGVIPNWAIHDEAP